MQFISAKKLMTSYLIRQKDSLLRKLKKTQYEDLIIKIYFNANETCKHEKRKLLNFVKKDI